MNTPPLQTVDILGTPIHKTTMKQALRHIEAAIDSQQALQIGVVNAAKIVNMKKDSELRDSVLSSDLILADGIAVVWASRILNRPLPERITGIDLMNGLFKQGCTRHYRFFCLGATEEVSRRVAKEIETTYPGAILAGRRNGYFDESEEESIAQDIQDSKADILLVAMTSPKKERFMAKWNKKMNTPIIHGVGGSFDVMAGKVERAPKLWQNLGLEWLYRVKQEPRRLWRRYLVTNVIFLSLLVKEKLLSD